MRWTTMRQDEGSILVLSLGFIVVCILAVAVVVDASAMFLERRSLQARADSAALAGAQAVDLTDYYARAQPRESSSIRPGSGALSSAMCAAPPVRDVLPPSPCAAPRSWSP